jgi:hypothetical protein
VGLAADPGGLLIQGVVPGELCDLERGAGIALTIHNRSDADRTYALSVHRPSAIGNRRVPMGYSDIPDIAWFRFETSEVSVPARGSARVRMFIDIPEDERYYNQHWSVSLGVKGKPEPGQMLALAVYPRYEIETAPAERSELALRPAGEVGVVPAVVTFSGDNTTHRGRTGLILVNGDSRRHAYTFKVLHSGLTPDGRDIALTAGYTWMPSPDYVEVGRPTGRSYFDWSIRGWPTLWLAARRYVSLPVEVRLPSDVSLPDGGWEAVIFVERDDGETGFARVLLGGSRAGRAETGVD